MSGYEDTSVPTSISLRRVVQKLDEMVNNLKDNVLISTTTLKKPQ